MTISYHVLALFWPKPIGWFVTAQMPIVAYHGSNAIAMLITNGELRRQLKAMLLCRQRIVLLLMAVNHTVF